MIIPEHVRSVGDGAFFNCSQISSVIIPNEVMEIGTNAFSGCVSLTKAEIGSAIETMGSLVFGGCEELKSLIIHNPTPPQTEEFESYQYFGTNLYVPEEAIEAYKNASVWKEFYNIEDLLAGVDTVLEDESHETGRYDINGKLVEDNYTGITIIRYSNGSYRKVNVK